MALQQKHRSTCQRSEKTSGKNTSTDIETQEKAISEQKYFSYSIFLESNYVFEENNSLYYSSYNKA